jgi:thiol-disulfide isomerase/thioredoxin
MNQDQGSRLKKIAVPLMVVALLILGCVQPADSPVEIELPSEPLKWLAEEERQPLDLSGTFLNLEGEEVSLLDPDAEGNVVFLNLWATWCGPCLAEMPAMASLYQQLSGSGFSMVAVSEEDPETVREFLADSPYPFKILMDPENVLGNRFAVISIPSTFIIDREGRLALRQTGAYHWDAAEVVEQFEPLLAGD